MSAGVSGDELVGRRVVVVNWRDTDHSAAGGAEIYAWQYAVALRDGGARVTFLTARERGQARLLERDGIEVRRGGGLLTFFAYAAAWLLLHRWRVDAVIDMSCGIPTYAPLFVPRSRPVLLVVHHVHQQQFATHFRYPLSLVGQWMERVAMRRVYRNCRVVAVSHSTRVEMREQLDWRTPIGLLENGADIPDASLVDAAAKEPDRIAVLGRLVTHKRVDLVLQALGEVVDRPDLRGRDLRLDVIGRGPEKERLERLAGELGIADRVTFHGYVSDEVKGALLARASLHVCASDAEGWGQSVIEAAGWGVPTIARNVPGLRDSIRLGETGWLVPDGPLDVVRGRLAEQLAEALEATDSLGVRAHRTAACQSWAEKFDWSQMRENSRGWTTEILSAAPAASNRPRATRAATAER
ncbi:MAG TPA: glycosyltransferase [Nocardioides sp.]|nr:glycosyltransferase [Nocardioides sp.]